MSQQHRPNPGSTANRPAHMLTPTPGPVALAPLDAVRDIHRNALIDGGATIGDLGPDTKGLFFLDYFRAHELAGILAEHPGIEWVQLPYAGVDAFGETIAEFGDRVLFTSAKGAYSEPVAEHALGLTIAANKEFCMRARATTWGPIGGQSLYEANVVIVGAGGIAIEYMKQIAPYRCHITVVRRADLPVDGADSTVTFEFLNDVLPQADVVLLAAANTKDTYKMMNAERLDLLKPNAVLINIGRGPLVDSDALDAALRAGKFFGAALDVTDPEPLPDDHPLWTNDRCLITPHVADTPDQVAYLLSLRVGHNVNVFLTQGEDWQGLVDPASGY
ncbi:D-isomer specific 2-hydroxyacid dehydrogenase family protein [Stomatohabitans albus]|uniref:D-isomer specific 2-hydroxyacid dehydrogenase family protein n=1 Tax=Stomatohabitans albus TaxID=3110766 RepID=UPI00300D923B